MKLPLRSEENNSRTEPLLISTLLALCLTLFFFGLGDRALWNIDEGMHAATSKDMVLTGDWLTPRFNGEKFYDKPPLHNWLVAISFLIFGFNEFAARLPAALLGLGCVMVSYLLGRRIFGKTASFLSAVVLATSAEYFILSRVVVHDISLAFFMTLALTLFYLGYKNRKHRKSVFLLGYAALGLAVLAKGPIGLLLPAAIIGLFLIFQRQLSFLKEMHIGWGLLIFSAVAAPWYVLASLNDPEFFRYFFLKQNLGNFFSEEVRHPEPLYFYIPILMGGMFPWSPLLPIAVYHGARICRGSGNDGTMFAMVWFITILVFFSLASSKLGTYILPLFPAAALLLGGFFADLLKGSSPVPEKVIFYSYAAVALVSALALVYLMMWPPMDLLAEGGIDIKSIYLVAVWLVVCCFLSAGFILKGKYRLFIGSTVGAVITIFLFTIISIAPQIEPYRSGKELARILDRRLEASAALVFYDKVDDTFLFYSNRKAVLLESLKQLRTYLDTDRQVFCIVRLKDWDDIEKLHSRIHIVAQQGDKFLVSNMNLEI